MMTVEVSKILIKDKFYTEIRKPFDPEHVQAQLRMGIPTLTDISGKQYLITQVEDNKWRGYPFIKGLYCTEWGAVWPNGMPSYTEMVKILPPFPRRPKPKHAGRLYQYLAEDISIFIKQDLETELLGYDWSDDEWHTTWGAIASEDEIEVIKARIRYDFVEIAIED